MSETENSPSTNSSPSPAKMVFKTEVLDELFSRVLRLTGISRREILAPIRESRVVDARFVIMLALRKRGLSSSSIGRLMNRDHTTVISAMRACRLRYEKSFEFRDLVDEVCGD